MKLLSATLAIIINCQLLTVSCGDMPNNKLNKPPQKAQPRFALSSPRNGQTITDAELLTLAFAAVKDSVTVDSCTLNVDGKPYVSFEGLRTEVDPRKLKLGVRRMSVNIYTSDNSVETIPFAVKVLPAVSPKQYTYSVVKQYPHDTQAYTQGLFYHQGSIYEGTGQYGSSSLRRIELASGKVTQDVTLDQQYFGEGICLHQGKIIQLTWRNRQGFIYDSDSFELIRKFEYQTEGWGITSDGTRLWMSDGSANIYVLDPLTMNVVDLVEVWTPDGRVDQLNELEYIEGELWANVYTQDYLARIDPATGRVNSIVDLKNLLRKELHTPQTDVLNGIAYDSANKRIFVTGKNWPILFELKIVEQ